MSRSLVFGKTRGRVLLLSLLDSETHAQLGRRVGIPRSTITAYADGSRAPSLAHALALRDRAGIAVDSWMQEASAQTVRLVASPAVILTESLPAASERRIPMTPALLEMARATIRTPQGRRPGELALAKAIVAEAEGEEARGSTSAFPNGETGQRAPAPETNASASVPDYLRRQETPLPEFLGGGSEASKPTPRSSAKDPLVTAPRSQGVTPRVQSPAEEKAEIDRLMGVVPVRPQFERLATGELVTRIRTRAQRAAYRSVAFGPNASLRGVIQRGGGK
jgi:hypothetical protein